MKLTILGSNAACPAAGRACSAYLVEHDQTSLLLDCGPASLPNLRRVIDYHEVSAVILSHLHADHLLDLVPYAYGLRYGLGGTGRRVPLWVPPGGIAHLAALALAVGGQADLFAVVFDTREYDPAVGLTIGPIGVTFAPTQHYWPAWALRLTAGGAVLVYSADSGPTPVLVEQARAADLFLCEATLLTRDSEEALPGHLTAAEAGAIAQAAGVRRLLLTHLWPELGLPALLAAARTTFSGPVALAAEGDTHLVAPG